MELSNYQIAEKIGSGGMATVFKAYQPKLDRYVAIKVMHQNIAQDPNFLARFEREARIVAKLDHPHIVPIYDFDEIEGQPYLVMKYVDGRTLKHILREGPLQPDQTLKIVREIGDALQYAHERGILHRDIKPSNILIDARGHAYLTDFGLARIVQQGESTMSVDVMLGTPHYISPEQARGETDIDARTDVYSLGIVMYELITGRVPFFGDTSYAIIHSQINNPPPLPREINPDIPEEVEAVLLRALAKDRHERYATPLDLVAAYEKALQGHKIAAPTSQVAPREQTPTPVMPTGNFWEKLQQWFENFEGNMEAFGEAMEREFSNFDRETAGWSKRDKWEESKRRFGSAYQQIKSGSSTASSNKNAQQKKRPNKNQDDALTPEERIRRRVERRIAAQQDELAGVVIHLIVFIIINTWLFGFGTWLTQFLTGESSGLPNFITMLWGIGLFSHIMSYLFNYGPGYRWRMAQVDREVEREYQRLGLGANKRKNDDFFQNADIVEMRLNDDGELTESFVDEMQNQQKRR